MLDMSLPRQPQVVTRLPQRQALRLQAEVIWLCQDLAESMAVSSATELGFRQGPVRLSGPKRYQVRSCVLCI
jgi:hypothetical protein